MAVTVLQNRRKAFQVLRARLMDRKLTQETVDRRDMRRSLVKSADRSEKVRTYNYTQVGACLCVCCYVLSCRLGPCDRPPTGHVDNEH